MKLATFNALLKVAEAYQFGTQFIDSYEQQKYVERRNDRLDKKFNEIVNTYWEGYNKGIPRSVPCKKDSEKALLFWVWGTEDYIEDPDPRLEAKINRIIEEEDKKRGL